MLVLTTQSSAHCPSTVGHCMTERAVWKAARTLAGRLTSSAYPERSPHSDAQPFDVVRNDASAMLRYGAPISYIT